MKANALPPSPQTTLVILLGASEWPYYPDFQASQAFANAAQQLKTYFLSPQQFALSSDNLLDLFNSPESADAQDESIGQFLEQRLNVRETIEQKIRDVILYFVGHGGFVGPNADYFLAIRRTRSANPRVSAISMVALADTLREKTRHLRLILILDCCFAAAAFQAFQADPSQIAITKTLDIFGIEKRTPGFPAKGVTLLCSSDHKTPSLLLPDNSSTMFSWALLEALSQGDPHLAQQDYLSLYEVKDLTARILHDYPERNAPQPALHSPDQSQGDIAAIPFFPNTILNEDLGKSQLARAESAPLRQDIHMLGDALGQAIQQHEGHFVFETVEQLRLRCKRLRTCAETLRVATPTEAAQLQQEIATLDQEITRIVDCCDLQTSIDVIRAFTVYFYLVNTAEQYHLIRRRSVYELHYSNKPQSGSLAALIEFLNKKRQLDAATVQQLLDSSSIELVFTAHPTEATPITQTRRIVELLKEQDHEDMMTPRQRVRWQRDLQGTIDLLWRTDPVRQVRPQLLDEIKMGIYYLDEILYDALPDLYSEFEELLRESYPQITVPPFLRLGSWIGGDQDGNPFVGPETLLKALHIQREHIIGHYRATIEALAQEFSQSLNLTSITQELKRSLDRDAARLPEYDRELGPQTALEPYRRKLSFMWKRLEATLTTLPPPAIATTPVPLLNTTGNKKEHGYKSADELLADLCLVRESLLADGEDDLAQGVLKKLIRQVELFGFYFASLDVRQHSERHATALAELLHVTGPHQNDYMACAEEERIRVLENLLRDPRLLARPGLQLSPETWQILNTFHTIKQAREEFGEKAVTCYIISRPHSLSDLLEVQFFCKEADLCDLPIVPLFGTINDLNECIGVLEQAFTHPAYQGYLASGQPRQQVMLDYSESSKDGGILTSSWELYQTQRKLADLGRCHNIGITFFHGRGGAIGRDGSPIYEAILGQPPNTVNAHLRIAEQGEMLPFKYGQHEIALHNMEQVVAGVMQSSVQASESREEQGDTGRNATWVATMECLSASAHSLYRRLIYNDPSFLTFFEQATPILEQEWLYSGSRPARRTPGRAIEILPAIPWAYSWMQTRYMLPSWYGVGGALEEYSNKDANHLVQLQQMYHDWPFWRAFLDNLQMALSKADMHTAQQYASLVIDPKLRRNISQEIEQEYERTCHMVLQIVGGKELLDTSPVLQQSLHHRNPYVDPLSYFQIELLRRLRPLGDPIVLDRDAEQKASEWDRERGNLTYAMLHTIHGIAAGVRNTD